MGSLTIGQAARLANVNVETIRFYQRKGLVEQPVRPDRSFRRYPQSAVDRLRFIKEVQQLGFSLPEVRSLLELEAGAAATCAQVRSTALETKKKVDEKIAKLKKMSAVLQRLSAGYGSQEERGCSIIDAVK